MSQIPIKKATCDDSQVASHGGGGNCTREPNSANHYNNAVCGMTSLPLVGNGSDGFGPSQAGQEPAPPDARRQDRNPGSCPVTPGVASATCIHSASHDPIRNARKPCRFEGSGSNSHPDVPYLGRSDEWHVEVPQSITVKLLAPLSRSILRRN